jgi:uncharacterized protein (DUF2147 family)
MQVSPLVGGALGAFVLLGSSGSSIADPIGLWRDKDGGTLRIQACGQALCGTIASVNPSIDPATGRPWTDKNNPDASLRNRPLVGVQALISMTPNGAAKWSGQLYDADRGKIYSGNLVEIDASTVRVEGCVLGLCGGETMTRVSR